MKKSATVACVLMFSASFLLIASVYPGLPTELPMLRNPITGGLAIASKSLFTAFRVPLMNLTHGLMVAVMLSHTTDFEDKKRRASYFALFSTLLFSIAFKSDFEALEISGLAFASGEFKRWATVGTVVSVVGGLGLAFVRGRKVPIPWTELRLSVRDKTILAGLFALYLAGVAASLLVLHRA